MKTLALLLAAAFFSASCFAQTKPSTAAATPAATAKTVPCQTVIKCRAELKEATEAATQFSNIADKLTTERDALLAQNKDLAAKLDGATTVLKVLDKEMRFVSLTDEDKKAMATIGSGSEILNLGIAIEKDQNEYVQIVQKLMSDNASIVQKYNALLSDYKDYVTRVGIELAQIGQANRISNALALYNAMPKYTPPQTVNVQIMNCTALPALCVH